MPERHEVVAQVVNLPLNALIVGENVRFALKQARVEALAESIREFGKVHTPLKVEPYEDGKFLVREGNYRHAAVQLLNKKGAGLPLPCIVEEPSDNPLDRIKQQLSENLDRENMSPMDTAITIQKLRERGLDRTSIRNLFHSMGGRKGAAMQPLSIAMYHFYVKFLDFPKKIQNKIHDGTLPVASAIELVNKPQPLWEAILEKVEANRAKEEEEEEKADNKIIEEEKKVAGEEDRIKELKASLETRLKEKQQWEEQAKKLHEETVPLFAKRGALKGEERKEADKAVSRKEAEAKVAEAKATDAQKDVEKIQTKLDNFAKQQAERAKQAEERARELERKAKVKREEVAAAAAQIQGGPVRLDAQGMRDAVAQWCLPGSFPKVQKIALIIDKVFKSLLTPTQGSDQIAIITGERPDKKAKAKTARGEEE